MDPHSQYVFVTWHGSIVFERDGVLIHRLARQFVPNVTFEPASRSLHCASCASVGSTFGRIDTEDVWYLCSSRGYLSAEESGEMSWKPHLQQWEKFTLRTLADAISEKNAPSFLTSRPWLRAYQHSRIPGIIHQTSRSREIPSSARSNVRDLKSLNPGYEYRYYSDQNVLDFIYREYGYDILNQYLRINPRYGAARADLFRYLCIYHCGGVYLDIKSGCGVALDTIIRRDDEYLLSYWPNRRGEKYQGIGFHADLSYSARGEYQHGISWPLLDIRFWPRSSRTFWAISCAMTSMLTASAGRPRFG